MVSVIIPNYNHAPYLKQRIDSVLNQTYKDFELIILDDKSTDNSIKIIEEYRDNPHISHIVYNEVNSGSTFRQWNKGIALAKGKYIWIAESDDCAVPELLSTLVLNIEKYENVSLSYSQSHRLNSKGEVTGDWLFHTKDREPELFDSDFFAEGDDFIQRLLIYKNVVPNASAVLFHKSAFMDVGGADEDIKYCADWMLWLKLLMVGNIAYTSQKLNYFRYHDTSVIASAVAGKEVFKKNMTLS